MSGWYLIIKKAQSRELVRLLSLPKLHDGALLGLFVLSSPSVNSVLDLIVPLLLLDFSPEVFFQEFEQVAVQVVYKALEWAEKGQWGLTYRLRPP